MPNVLSSQPSVVTIIWNQHLNGHEIVLLIPFRKVQKLISRLQPSRPLVFYLSVVYFTLIYFTIYLNNFIDSVLKLYWITQVMYIFNYTISIKVTRMWVSFTDHTYLQLHL